MSIQKILLPQDLGDWLRSEHDYGTIRQKIDLAVYKVAPEMTVEDFLKLSAMIPRPFDDAVAVNIEARDLKQFLKKHRDRLKKAGPYVSMSGLIRACVFVQYYREISNGKPPTARC